MYTADDKLKYEIEKLQLDIKEKQRSPFYQTAFWFPALAVAVSFSGNILQWTNSKGEKTLAEIQVARAHIDKQNAEADLKALQQQIAAAQLTYDSLNRRVEAEEKRLQEIADKSGQMRPPQLLEALVGARESLADIRQTNQETSRRLGVAETGASRGLRR